MKIFSILVLCALALVPVKPAHAVVSSAASVRLLFSQASATTTAWLTVDNQAAKALKGLSVFQTSPVPLQVAIGASGSEVVQIVVPAGVASQAALPGGVMQPGAIFYPIPISQGTKIAVRALDSSAATGELQVNEFFY